VGSEGSIYTTQQELKVGLIKAYKEFVEEYAAVGKIIQFDDCTWEMFSDDNPISPYRGKVFS
jgi:methionine synthase II (cobalamin-independent)